MRSLLVACPLALYTTACATRPWTPSAPVAYWAEEPALERPITVPTQTDTASWWQLPPESPWKRYEKLTLIASLDTVPRAAEMPDVAQLDVVAHAQQAALAVAAAGLPSDSMWVVDLRGAASVAFGAALSRRAQTPIAPVLTFNNWPAEEELIPAEETLAALVTMSPRLPQPSEVGARPVFLLDAWRLAYRFEPTEDDVTDNRYYLTQSDLPDVETLQQQGIRKLVYVVESLDDTSVVEDDLQETFLAYQHAGIQIYMVDLPSLSRELSPGPESWGSLESHGFYVEVRPTILEDPRFYVRAHGGFGGAHSGPSPFYLHYHRGAGWAHFGGGG
jgi:hypothetical protein